MSVLLDPIGFLADFIAICNAFGIYTPAQQKQTEIIHRAIAATHGAIESLSHDIQASREEIMSMLTTASTIEVRSRISKESAFASEKIELLIKLLICIKERASNVVFAVVVKYKFGSRAATLGFAGTSSDAVEQLFERIERFYRGISLVKPEKTAYINVRIRGRFNADVENFCAAALSAVATHICGLSNSIRLENVIECPIEPSGSQTLVLLHPDKYEDGRTAYDRIRRVFLIGDTRSGKSTLGNAILREGVFQVSKGMTGTMRVERGERIDDADNALWVTEIYDTPGLNDKDGLDVFYQSAIEDQIRILQRASTLVMTISADAGITGANFNSLQVYKELFGDGIASMLVIVLTTNEPATKDTLVEYKEFNWPTIAGLDDGIVQRNVFCVSLHDLRTKATSSSHEIVEQIAHSCRCMELKIIESLAIRYRELRNSLLRKSSSVSQEVQELMNDGWLMYESLAKQYESSRYVKMTSTLEAFGQLDGFVMKNHDPIRRVVAAGTAGMVNCIRKTAITVERSGKNAEKAWQKLVKGNRNQEHHSNLMWVFGELVDSYNLGLIVRDQDVYYIGTLRVKPYTVVVIDPVNHAQDELTAHLENILEGKEDDLRPEVISELLRSVIPTSIRFNRQWSRKRRTQSNSTGNRKPSPAHSQ